MSVRIPFSHLDYACDHNARTYVTKLDPFPRLRCGYTRIWALTFMLSKVRFDSSITVRRTRLIFIIATPNFVIVSDEDLNELLSGSEAANTCDQVCLGSPGGICKVYIDVG